MERYSRSAVATVCDLDPSLFIPSNPVLGREEGHELHPGGLGEAVNGRDTLRVDAGVVRDEAHSSSLHQVERILEQNVDAG
jgi:hypothetical protein